MTAHLPANLLQLFQPRDPVQFLPPSDKLPWEKKRRPYTGLASFVDKFEDPEVVGKAPAKPVETREEKRQRRKREKAELATYRLEQGLALWNPKEPQPASGIPVTSDPYKTLFVGRLSYLVTEREIEREFEEFGPIKRVTIIRDVYSKGHDGEPKSRGYAFIEYDHEKDMHDAYKYADGRKIDGRRVVVDVERGRTIEDWRPRRFGGGRGKSKRDMLPERQRSPSPVTPVVSSRSYDRSGGNDGGRYREERGGYRGRDSYAERDYRDRGDYRERERRGDRAERERSPRRYDRDRERERDRYATSRRSRSPRGGDHRRRRDRERSPYRNGSAVMVD